MNTSIRKSGSGYSTTVPYTRMNQEMQRITRLGGKIVSIRPLEDGGGHEQREHRLQLMRPPAQAENTEKPMTQAKPKKARGPMSRLTFTSLRIPLWAKSFPMTPWFGKGGSGIVQHITFDLSGGDLHYG